MFWEMKKVNETDEYVDYAYGIEGRSAKLGGLVRYWKREKKLKIIEMLPFDEESEESQRIHAKMGYIVLTGGNFPKDDIIRIT